MSEFPAPRGHNSLSGAAAEAVESACSRQLELVQYRLRSNSVSSIDDCRESVDDWNVDECLVLEMDVDERLSFLERYADEYDLELGPVTLEELRSRLETMTATIVAQMGAELAQDALREVEELLEDHDLPIEALLADNPYEFFRHFGERDDPPWHVYQYRNLEGQGLHVDLYELNIEGISLYVRQELERGTLSAEEETWEAS